MLSTLVAAVLFTATPAHAQDAIPVTLRVTDQSGAPIGMAKVRHPEEKELHPVNSQTGEWTESILYMLDGSEFRFAKGTQLVLEVSAPGYLTRTVRYEVRKRGNVLPVLLEDFDPEPDEPLENVVIGFDRDVPLDK